MAIFFPTTLITKATLNVDDKHAQNKRYSSQVPSTSWLVWVVIQAFLTPPTRILPPI